MQCGVYREVDGAGGDAGVVVMDQQGVVSDLMSRCPPPDNHLGGIDLPVQLVHVLGKVQLNGNLIHQPKSVTVQDYSPPRQI